MRNKKTYEEINEKIKKGEAVVLTAEEVTVMAKEMTVAEIAREVDVVTTATFGPMCSSGAFINFGHSEPPIRMEKITLNDVAVFSGLAAVDAYIGATEVSPYDEKYGGAHIIEELIAGKDVLLKAWGKGTDCYPRQQIETHINKDTVNEIFMFNPRNSYQNYGAACNSSKKIKFTYMGVLLPNLGNITYSTSGELSPLINDPELRTIGIGTKIFLCGAEGYVIWNGTQFNTGVQKNNFGIPYKGGATLSVIGDLKKMSENFIKAVYYENYGVSLFVGIGIPIPILDEDMANFVTISNNKIHTTIFDYGLYDKPEIAKVTYAELKTGKIKLFNKEVRTAPLSSLKKAREIAETLKNWILSGDFTLTKPVSALPDNIKINKLKSDEEILE